MAETARNAAAVATPSPSLPTRGRVPSSVLGAIVPRTPSPLWGRMGGGSDLAVFPSAAAVAALWFPGVVS